MATARTKAEAISFPEKSFLGWPGEFAELYSRYTEAPKSFYFMTALTCLGNLVCRRITLASVIRPQPRLYTVILGESGDDRKSTAIRLTVEFFLEALGPERFAVCHGVGSAEGLAEELSLNPDLLLVCDEFKTFVNKAKIAERYDLAVCSTKGLPVSALCNLLSRCGLTTYVVHDFDKSGFSIVGSLRHGTRGSEGTGKIIDLGFRLADIEGLPTEDVSYPQEQDPSRNLRRNGATEAEIAMLVQGSRGHWRGRRCELNAMTTDQFVSWLEGKLQAAGIKKVVPAKKILEKAYRRAVFQRTLVGRAAALQSEIGRQALQVPSDLAARIREALEQEPEQSWDEAVWRLAQADSEDTDE